MSSETKSLRATSREAPSEQRLRRRQRQDVFFTPARHGQNSSCTDAQADHLIGESTGEVQTHCPPSLSARRTCNVASAALIKKPPPSPANRTPIPGPGLCRSSKPSGPCAGTIDHRKHGRSRTTELAVEVQTRPAPSSRGRRTELPPAPSQRIEPRAATCPRYCIQSTGSSPSCE